MYIKNITLVFVIIFAFVLLKLKAFVPAIIMILIVPFLYNSIKRERKQRSGNNSNSQDKIIYDNEIDEALDVLGISDKDIDDLTVEDIEKVHKNLIKSFHPDQGGSNYLASKINKSKELLVTYIKNKQSNDES